MERKRKSSKARIARKRKKVSILPAPGRSPAAATPTAGNQFITTTTKPFSTPIVIQNSTVLTILANRLSGFVSGGQFQLRTVISDNSYHPASVDFVRTAIVTDPVLSPASYHADVFDCDDYVQYLKTKLSLYAASNQLTRPLAVGYILTVLHAFSFCISEQGSLILVNTQSPTGNAPFEQNPAGFQNFLQVSAPNPITSIYI